MFSLFLAAYAMIFMAPARGEPRRFAKRLSDWSGNLLFLADFVDVLGLLGCRNHEIFKRFPIVFEAQEQLREDMAMVFAKKRAWA